MRALLLGMVIAVGSCSADRQAALKSYCADVRLTALISLDYLDRINRFDGGPYGRIPYHPSNCAALLRSSSELLGYLRGYDQHKSSIKHMLDIEIVRLDSSKIRSALLDAHKECVAKSEPEEEPRGMGSVGPKRYRRAQRSRKRIRDLIWPVHREVMALMDQAAAPCP